MPSSRLKNCRTLLSLPTSCVPVAAIARHLHDEQLPLTDIVLALPEFVGHPLRFRHRSGKLLQRLYTIGQFPAYLIRGVDSRLRYLIILETLVIRLDCQTNRQNSQDPSGDREQTNRACSKQRGNQALYRLIQTGHLWLDLSRERGHGRVQRLALVVRSALMADESRVCQWAG